MVMKSMLAPTRDGEEDAHPHMANPTLLPQVGSSTQCSYGGTIAGTKEMK